MPEYLAPGVYIEETSVRKKSIKGVGTSVASIVGSTRTGPVRGVPDAVTSAAEFGRVFGDADDLAFDGAARPEPNWTAHAARAFFDNGGKQLYVTRVFQGVNQADANGAGGSAKLASAADPNGVLTFQARFPGAMGNYTLEVRWRDGESLLQTEQVKVAAKDRTCLLEAQGVTKEAKAAGPLGDDQFPIDVQAVVKLGAGELTVVENRARIRSRKDPAHPAEVPAAQVTAFDPAHLPANAKLTRLWARAPASGPLTAGTAAVLVLSHETDLSDFSGVAHWGPLLTLYGTLDAAGEVLSVTKALNPSVAADFILPLSALAAAPGAASAIIALRTFDLEVRQTLPVVKPDGTGLVPAGSRRRGDLGPPGAVDRAGVFRRSAPSGA